MEDQHTCVTEIPGLEGHAFFAVYDGHGGKNAAIISNDTVLPSIMKQKQFQEYCARPPAQRDPQLLAQAMADGFVQCDAEMRPKIPPPDTSGAPFHPPVAPGPAGRSLAGARFACPAVHRVQHNHTTPVFIFADQFGARFSGNHRHDRRGSLCYADALHLCERRRLPQHLLQQKGCRSERGPQA